MLDVVVLHPREAYEAQILCVRVGVGADEEPEGAACIEFSVRAEADVPHHVELLRGEGEEVLLAYEPPFAVAHVDIGEAAVERGYPEPVGAVGVEVVDEFAVGGVIVLGFGVAVRPVVRGFRRAGAVLYYAGTLGPEPDAAVAGLRYRVDRGFSRPEGDFVQQAVQQVDLAVPRGHVYGAVAALEHGSDIVGGRRGAGARVDGPEPEFSRVVAGPLQSAPGAGEPQVALTVHEQCVEAGLGVPCRLEPAVVERNQFPGVLVVPVQASVLRVYPEVAEAVALLPERPSVPGVVLYPCHAPIGPVPAEQPALAGAGEEFFSAWDGGYEFDPYARPYVFYACPVFPGYEHPAAGAADVELVGAFIGAQPGYGGYKLLPAVYPLVRQDPDRTVRIGEYRDDVLSPRQPEAFGQCAVLSVPGVIAFQHRPVGGHEAEVVAGQLEDGLYPVGERFPGFS